jgi:DNA-binding NarL/FixJ family response regulator
MRFPPAYLFPTTVVLLDDDKDFLCTIKGQLNLKYTGFKSFNSASLARNFLTKWRSNLKEQDNLLRICPSENNYENLAIEIQFSKILTALFDPHRFEHITTVIVDYQMPELDGISFLKEIADFPAKKILLTGVANADLAIEAMEQGLIDAYVKKHDNNMAKKLNHAIKKHQLSYFESKSELVKNSLKIAHDDQYVTNAYCQLVNTITQRHNAIEYYLIDQNGSYAFFDENGDRLDLIIKSKEQLESELDATKDCQIDKKIRAQLKNCELMLAPNLDDQHFLKALPLDKNRHFFYALDKNLFSIDADSVRPYRCPPIEALA